MKEITNFGSSIEWLPSQQWKNSVFLRIFKKIITEKLDVPLEDDWFIQSQVTVK